MARNVNKRNRKCRGKPEITAQHCDTVFIMSLDTPKRSEYYFKLNKLAKERYEQKLAELKISNDPFVLDNTDFDLTESIRKWPDVSFADIFCFLINYPSQFSSGSLKAYKSLESYNYVTSGLVSKVRVKKIIENNFLIVAKVRHGQSQFTKKPEDSWLGIKSDSSIINAHCTCMAGVGEACSHVGAVMFYLMLTSEYNKRNLGDDACTSLPCAWLPPSATEVAYLELSEIDFTSSKRKFMSMMDQEKGDPNQCKKTVKIINQTEKPTNKEINTFFDSLASTGEDVAILRLVPPHNDKYISVKSKLKKLMFNFYEKKYDSFLYHQLIQASIAKYLTMSISQTDVELVEKHTREQAKPEVWFQARSGVITASRFRQCCHSDVSQPSRSLILQVCYPQKNKFSSDATDYGIKKEKEALSYLECYLKQEHTDVIIKESGLIRSTEYPFLGASPDGILNCSCCLKDYIIEIKCPFKCETQTTIDLAKTDKTFCMEYRNDGKYYLKRDHAYYYQVQLQMFLSNLDQCYFLVWTSILFS